MPKQDPILTLKEERKYDFLIISVVVLLTAMGMAFIYSATYESQMSGFLTKQIIAASIGIVSMIILAILPKKYLIYTAYLSYVGSILLLVLVLLIGQTVYGTKGWINIGGFSLQPAEFAKVGTLMMLAAHLARKGANIKNPRDLIIAIGIVALPAILIIRQPDIGSMTVLLFLFIAILFWSGYHSHILYFVVTVPIVILLALKDRTYFLIAASVLSIVAFTFRKNLVMTISGIALFFVVGFGAPRIYENLMEHQKARIDTFLNPGSDPQGTGYNVIQSIMAVGSGGVSGKGYLQGTQTQLRYIPMQWTDFIFSVPTEEFGFIGGSIVILLYFLLIYRIVYIANEVEDSFYSLLSFGVASIFLYHVTINIGMSIGLMPVMGIPLPYLSYGGTAMLINLSLAGLVLNAWRDYKSEKKSYL